MIFAYIRSIPLVSDRLFLINSTYHIGIYPIRMIDSYSVNRVALFSVGRLLKISNAHNLGIVVEGGISARYISDLPSK